MLVELPGAPTAVKEIVAAVPPVMGLVPNQDTAAEPGPVMLMSTPLIVPGAMLSKRTTAGSQLTPNPNPQMLVPDTLTVMLPVPPGSIGTCGLMGAIGSKPADPADTMEPDARTIARVTILRVTSSLFTIANVPLFLFIAPVTVY